MYQYETFRSVTVVTGRVTLPVSAPTLMDKMVEEVEEDVVAEVVGIEEEDEMTVREVRSATSTSKFFLVSDLWTSSEDPEVQFYESPFLFLKLEPYTDIRLHCAIK